MIHNSLSLMISPRSFFPPAMIQRAKETDWPISFAECYVTIMVSCSPAISSFWKNVFSKSTFYSSLRSRLTFSRSTRSRNTKEPSPGYAVKQAAFPRSCSHLVRNSSGYYELHDKAYKEPLTVTYSPGFAPFDGKWLITKSTTIDQSTEKH